MQQECHYQSHPPELFKI